MKYEKPNASIIYLDNVNVITASSGTLNSGGADTGNDRFEIED